MQQCLNRVERESLIELGCLRIKRRLTCILSRGARRVIQNNAQRRLSDGCSSRMGTRNHETNLIYNSILMHHECSFFSNDGFGINVRYYGRKATKQRIDTRKESSGPLNDFAPTLSISVSAIAQPKESTTNHQWYGTLCDFLDEESATSLSCVQASTVIRGVRIICSLPT